MMRPIPSSKPAMCTACKNHWARPCGAKVRIRPKPLNTIPPKMITVVYVNQFKKSFVTTNFKQEIFLNIFITSQKLGPQKKKNPTVTAFASLLTCLSLITARSISFFDLSCVSLISDVSLSRHSRWSLSYQMSPSRLSHLRCLSLLSLSSQISLSRLSQLKCLSFLIPQVMS